MYSLGTNVFLVLKTLLFLLMLVVAYSSIVRLCAVLWCNLVKSVMILSCALRQKIINGLLRMIISTPQDTNFIYAQN